MKKIVNLAVAAAAAFAALPAAAQNVQFGEDGSYRVAVSYADLNLSSAAGKRTLEGRLKAAAKSVCGAAGGTSLIESRNIEACRDNVMGATRPQVEIAYNGGGSGNISVAMER